MAIIKCKMCGGDLTLTEGQSVAECEYCGSRQTVPNQDNEKKLQQFQRADWLRRNCEFDRAAAVYESIVAEFREEAEAYWGLVLCKFGIEYVDDPGTGKKIPTCHRSSFESVMEDPSLELAMDYADTVARRVYREEAKQIEEIRKGIIAVSANEQPYDIFICYKETDEKGERTLDSVLAQDIYDVLNEKGYRVFFARISLEDKLGVEYEPYIFAALNSAKIMLAVGTDYEYYNAVWVKNEWSRYLKLMAQDKTRHLIPCYKNIDAYDMPKEFAKLQAQDLGKVGAMQDLLRGIEKILPRQKNTTVIQERVVVGGAAGYKITAALERGNMALEDGEWAKADSFFEDVLSNDARNAQAYLGKVLAQEKCRSLDAFIRKRLDASQPVRGEKLVLQPDTAHVEKMAEQYLVPGYLEAENIGALYEFDLGYLSQVSQRKQQLKDEETYWATHKILTKAEKFAEGEVAQTLVREKKRLFDALAQRVKQAEKEETAAIEEVRQRCETHLSRADEKARVRSEQAAGQREKDYSKLVTDAKNTEDPKVLDTCAEKFDDLGDFRDSKALAEHCRKRAEEIREEIRQKEIAEKARLAEEEERRLIAGRKAEREAAAKKKKITIISIAAAVVALAVLLLVTRVIIPASNYNKAEALAAEGKYLEAAAVFADLGKYKDSPERNLECLYAQAESLVAEGRYAEAAIAFYRTGSYKDARQRSDTLWDQNAERQSIGIGSIHILGLKTDGTAVSDGNSVDGKCNVGSWKNLVAVTTGFYHSVGLRSDGTVVAVGENDNGQCNVSNWTDIVAIAAGNAHTVGLKADGTVVATHYAGSYYTDQCEVADWTNIVAIAAGNSHTVGLKADGTVTAVGFNDDGQCDVGDWQDIVAISAGRYHTVGLKADGTVVAVGNNDYGRCDVSGWRDIVAISAGWSHTVGLKADGTVVTVGYNADGQCDVSGWSDIVAVFAGNEFTVGLKDDGRVVLAGSGEYVELNISGWKDIKVPD